jgi:hypothetical protein
MNGTRFRFCEELRFENGWRALDLNANCAERAGAQLFH